MSLFLIIILILYVLIFLTIYPIIVGAPFVPTPKEAIRSALKKINSRKGQIFFDLGAGDARSLKIAEKEFGLQGFGFEISPFIFLITLINKYRWHLKSKIFFKDARYANFKKADIIFLYQNLPNMKLFWMRKLQNLKEKTSTNLHLISYAFPLDIGKPTYTLKPKGVELPVYIYRISACRHQPADK